MKDTNEQHPPAEADEASPRTGRRYQEDAAAEADEEPKKKAKQKRGRRRILPIWLRLIIVTILFAVSLVIGLIAGYSWFGDAEGYDVLQPSTWQQLLDFIQAND
ncbi:DNA-directed RNA polymerase subunit beta [Salsuginibacillus halophilus]|uniref:DNA-directed RNA polymerase subunit beta n=1 Tax=Salsuginibacillus halophilus TaxID=517424 RepID=A0A2P8HHQ8_9BACI|nr:DNA-directed RNA polymerase subunit beta [Salsuginibacillus halophilus]PSL45756.1 DNA-directed RNA polymerase subunit beta [Salsuginibacillus halophilus]